VQWPLNPNNRKLQALAATTALDPSTKSLPR
jgi:hypothetical protein